MKTFIVAVCLIAFAIAEPPPSNSYLPPSPSDRTGGYSSGRPQGGAGRSFEHDHGGNGFSRGGSSHGQGRFGGDQGYDHNASPFGRNGLDGASDEPANYNFGYSVNDYQEGTDFGHHEERQDERAEGEYHVVLPDGRKQTVSYEADERGFKPHISYEDSDASGRAGYDSNANNVRGGHGNGYSNGGRGRSGNGY